MKEKNEKDMMKKKSNKEMIVIFVLYPKKKGEVNFHTKKASSFSSFVISSQVTSFGFLDVESCVR